MHSFSSEGLIATMKAETQNQLFIIIWKSACFKISFARVRCSIYSVRGSSHNLRSSCHSYCCRPLLGKEVTAKMKLQTENQLFIKIWNAICFKIGFVLLKCSIYCVRGSKKLRSCEIVATSMKECQRTETEVQMLMYLINLEQSF